MLSILPVIWKPTIFFSQEQAPDGAKHITVNAVFSAALYTSIVRYFCVKYKLVRMLEIKISRTVTELLFLRGF